ncbi:MAG: LamG domain-containing protein [Candidatus Nanoarchaeia archaeon]
MIDKKEIAKKVKRELAWLAKAITIFYCIGLMLTTPMILAQEPNISESENLTIENLTADQDITITENNTSEGNQTENNETNISYLVVTKPNPIEINTSDENSTLEKTQSGFTGSDFVTQDETSAPDIEFVEPTPADQTITLNTSTETNITITETSLGKFIWNWNETNYTIYDDDLVLMMNFEKLTTIGENDTYIKDISKSNNDGTFYTNGTETHGYVTNGKQNGGWLFDGDGDYIDCGTGSSLNITDNVTVEVWVRATSVGGASDWRSIAGKGGGAWYIYQEQNAGPYNFELNTEITGWTWTYLGAVDPGNWHHLVATFDSGLDSNQIKTYRDGVLQSQSTSSGRIGDNSALNCYIGGGPAGYTRYFNGT